MKLYTETEQYKLYEGSMLDMLDVIPENSIDSIVTDPPYELNFMNKGWDRSGIAFQKETWEKCLKVLKPGGYILAFGGSRTFHRIACAIEDAGFEIRDTVMWLYGSGFPKSMNIAYSIDKKLGYESVLEDIKPGHSEFVGRTTTGHIGFDGAMSGFDRPWMHDSEKYENSHYQKIPTSEEAKSWQGWGTAFKPSFEPVIVARKPCEGSITDNVLKYGVGGINIDECRILTEDTLVHGGVLRTNSGDDRTGKSLGMFQDGTENTFVQNPNGRFPANVILTYDDSDFDEVCGGMPYTKSTGGSGEASKINTFSNTYNGGWGHDKNCANLGGLGDEGSAARYFYCAKASKLDRDEGLDAFIEHSTGELQGGRKEGSAGSVMNPLRPDGHTRNNPLNPYAGAGGIKKNIHPTVKPTSLMQYLVRLVTPKNGTILDPFNGSGSTGKAVIFENRSRNADYKYIGIELSDEYLAISKARIDYAMTADMTVDDTGSVKLSNSSNNSKSQHKTFKLFDI